MRGRLVDSFLQRSRDEAGALRLERRVAALAAHRAPQPLRLADGEAGEMDGDVEHLVLEDDDAERLPQRLLQQRMVRTRLVSSRRRPALSSRRRVLPSRKEIQWAQLRVGALVLLAMAVLVGLIFLMSGATGGLFARKLVFRSYFENAAGVKDGAPVTLEGVTIGNVTHIRVVPSRNPTPVEVTMQVGEEFLRDLHTDSTASIAQAGVLAIATSISVPPMHRGLHRRTMPKSRPPALPAFRT